MPLVLARYVPVHVQSISTYFLERDVKFSRVQTKYFVVSKGCDSVPIFERDIQRSAFQARKKYTEMLVIDKQQAGRALCYNNVDIINNL